MQYEINGPFKASQLFDLDKHTKNGLIVPEYADRKAVPKVGKNDPRFTGTGIYGVLFRDKLVYVGIFTGNKGKLFDGSVVHERWKKHLTFFTMRSPECAASPTNLKRILTELKGGPVDALFDIFAMKGLSVDDLKRSRIGFANGASTQFNKVRFATENWETFRPGNEELMLEEMSFVYARFMPTTRTLLSPVATKESYVFVKQEWLEPRERRLFEEFEPACNSQTVTPNLNVDTGMFITALHREMSLPIPPQNDPALIAA